MDRGFIIKAAQTGCSSRCFSVEAFEREIGVLKLQYVAPPSRTQIGMKTRG